MRRPGIDLDPGERVGDWIVGEALGRGGMATVYRCSSALSPRLQGALKVVDKRLDSTARDRFVREIDTLAALRHPGVIRVLSAGEDRSRHLLYMVMELIEGEDLAQHLSRERMPWREAARAFRDVADALAHAHTAGIHHRDLKPANVMINPDGSGMLVDFGIALDEDRTRLTQVGMVPGTVAYMPPELLLSDSRSIDPALADVYAFGLVFYEAITRKRAFPGFQQASRADLIRLVKEKLEHDPFDPGDQAPQAIRGLIKGCTQPMPLKRPRMSGVVRILDIALGPVPGMSSDGGRGPLPEDNDEPTMIVHGAEEILSPPTFNVDTVTGTPTVPVRADERGGSGRAELPRDFGGHRDFGDDSDFGGHRDFSVREKESEVETKLMDREAVERELAALAPVPIEEPSARQPARQTDRQVERQVERQPHRARPQERFDPPSSTGRGVARQVKSPAQERKDALLWGGVLGAAAGLVVAILLVVVVVGWMLA